MSAEDRRSERICLRYQEVCGDRLAFSCECAGDCPFRPQSTRAAR